MALTDETSGIPATMLVGPTGFGGTPYPVYQNGGNNNGGFGGDWGWIVLLLLLAGNGGWGMGGFGGFGGAGNMMLGYDFPWVLNGQQNIMSNTNNGFRDQMINDNITSIRDGVSGLSTQLCGCCGDIQNTLCGGFAGVTSAVTGAQNALAQQMYTNQISDLERSFAAQTASTQGMSAIQAQLAQCCCDNRAATQDVKYTIATEACATRANSTANTQAILDKLCQLELDGYKRENDSLRTQLTAANLAASQTAQTAIIRDGQNAAVASLVNELRSCPIPSQPVYGSQPIFTCPNNNNGCGCGCGNNF